MPKVHGYIQNKQSKAILWSGHMTQENAEHFLTSRGLSVSDHTIVIDASDIDVQGMIDTYDESLKTYADKRRDEYPSIVDQLDKIYHDGIDSWKADMIKPVKDKYPKE